MRFYFLFHVLPLEGPSHKYPVKHAAASIEMPSVGKDNSFACAGYLLLQACIFSLEKDSLGEAVKNSSPIILYNTVDLPFRPTH